MKYPYKDAKIKQKVEFIITYCICTSRRAHLKECFDVLKQEVPTLEDKKTSNLNILRSALKHIQVRDLVYFGSTVSLGVSVSISWGNLNLKSYCVYCEQV